MYNFIFLAIIVTALVVVAVVATRKFPQVANLDLDNLSEEQENKKKRELLSRRLEARGKKAEKIWAEKMVPLVDLWGKLQAKFRVYVGRIEKLLHYEELLKHRTKVKAMPAGEKEYQIGELLQQAENHVLQSNFDKAEELYIAAIKLDKKSVPAYRGLADTYMAKGAVDEAFQTYAFLSKLLPSDDNLLVKLGEIAEERGRTEEAIQYYEQATVINDSLSPRFYHLAELLRKSDQPDIALEAIAQAVELEPKNPKYLDLLIETAIICGNKTLAEKNFEELRLVNPENHKLNEFKEKIEKMPL
ncbi:MAG: tetratricopeptide repeat protein [Patescibacteria group bacterium]|nr:tetratricopeptide repeat protein [Patescibacteria group bacterium]